MSSYCKSSNILKKYYWGKIFKDYRGKTKELLKWCGYFLLLLKQLQHYSFVINISVTIVNRPANNSQTRGYLANLFQEMEEQL